MLSQIITALLPLPPSHVTVEDADGADALGEQIRRLGAGMVILPDGAIDPSALLHTCAGALLLALDHDGHGATLHSLQLHSERIDELSADTLLDIVVNAQSGRPH